MHTQTKGPVQLDKSAGVYDAVHDGFGVHTVLYYTSVHYSILWHTIVLYYNSTIVYSIKQYNVV